MHHLLRKGKKVGTAIVGTVVLLTGLVLIPYPGPGWLIVFAGFAILSTEFTFASKALAWLKVRYEKWQAWMKVQPVVVQLLFLAFTGLVVLVTIYLLNTFGLLNEWLQLGQPWLQSPLFTKE